MPSQEQDLSYFNLCAYLLLLFLQKHELQFSVWFENMVSYKPSLNKFYQVYEGSFKWLKLRNQKCSLAFQASLLVKLRINWRSWKNGSWSITHYCVYPWPFPYSGAREGAVVRELASHQCGPDTNRGVDAICGLSLLLVFSLAPRDFSPGSSVSTSFQKPAFPNSNSL